MQRDGHYPHQSAIDFYGNGGFRFAEMSHKGSLLCLPTGMHAWHVKDISEVNQKTLAPALDLADQIDVLLLGQGQDISFFPADLRDLFRQKKIIVEAVTTSSAISTYNILFGENRAVAAALISVERATK